MSEFDVDDEAPEEQEEPIPPPPPAIPEHVPDDWLDPKPTDPAGR
jgi:hypothetical protein